MEIHGPAPRAGRSPQGLMVAVSQLVARWPHVGRSICSHALGDERLLWVQGWVQSAGTNPQMRLEHCPRRLHFALHRK